MTTDGDAFVTRDREPDPAADSDLDTDEPAAIYTCAVCRSVFAVEQVYACDERVICTDCYKREQQPQAAGAHAGNLLAYQGTRDDARARRVLARARRVAAWAGGVLGVVILVCLNLPIPSLFGTRSTNWWDLSRFGAIDQAFIFCVYTLLSGVALLGAGLIAPATVRGAIMLALGAIPFALLAAGMGWGDVRAAIGSVLPAVAAATLLGTSAHRLCAPGDTAGRVWQQSAGACLLAAVAMATWIALELFALAEPVSTAAAAPWQAPDPAVQRMRMFIGAAKLLTFFNLLCAAGAGAVALLPRATQGRCYAIRALLICYFLIPLLMLGMILVLQGGNATVVSLLLRAVAVVGAYLVAIGLGVHQLLLGQHFGRFTTSRAV